ncbi:HD domain-containing phosphohydrolase [Leadbettera azotonutricia]|uniref:Response regulator n=1 Tax=Leadbettera azotonutricia (strain ATCC BAA-888 / DSM 13862 / ZAS-9) TaxID=545695 RepID=F5YFT1_LEAAZ|nr:HD domain-containing phosphohydrolase [Leadbettera azotonutricia]AEF81109.1 response regulator [Leadbettera azotonutricia ZAS-9]
MNCQSPYSVENGRKRILLVDDSQVNLKMARNTLMNKYDVFTVPSAEKMFLFLESNPADLILLDILMPNVSGYKAISVLKKNEKTRDIPVIFLTSKSDPGSELEGFNLGAVDYIAKPFSPPLLIKRVDAHMLVESQKRELQYLNDNLQHLVDEKTGAVLSLQNGILKTISNLVEWRDDVTGEHVERTEYSLRILTEAMRKKQVYIDELENWNLELFFQSAQLHDVGKIAIRDQILLKTSRLTPEEFEEMKKHTTFGERIIKKIQEGAKETVFLTHARIMAGSHHEKWDGSGYPRGLAGEDIPLQGRIMAVVDVYDALVSQRPYKKAFSPDEAAGIIGSEKGRHFDPRITDIFLEVYPQFRLPVQVLHFEEPAGEEKDVPA